MDIQAHGCAFPSRNSTSKCLAWPGLAGMIGSICTCMNNEHTCMHKCVLMCPVNCITYILFIIYILIKYNSRVGPKLLTQTNYKCALSLFEIIKYERRHFYNLVCALSLLTIDLYTISMILYHDNSQINGSAFIYGYE